jgi:hypothetical protein
MISMLYYITLEIDLLELIKILNIVTVLPKLALLDIDLVITFVMGTVTAMMDKH